MISLSQSMKAHLVNCTWTLETLQPSQHITLTVTHMDIIDISKYVDSVEDTEDCPHGGLRVRTFGLNSNRNVFYCVLFFFKDIRWY